MLLWHLDHVDRETSLYIICVYLFVDAYPSQHGRSQYCLDYIPYHPPPLSTMMVETDRLHSALAMMTTHQAPDASHSHMGFANPSADQR